MLFVTGFMEPDFNYKSQYFSKLGMIELKKLNLEINFYPRRIHLNICKIFAECGEYKSMRTKKLVALPLAGGPSAVEVNVSSCAPDTAPLIIGGQLARIETFPHMALVGWKNLQVII